MSNRFPQSVCQFIEGLEILCPDVEVTPERGGKTSGVWWIDIAASQTHIVVQWNPAIGFSLEEVGDDELVYGALPAERHKTVLLALTRVMSRKIDQTFV